MAAVIAEPESAKAATLTDAGEMRFYSFPIEKVEDAGDGTIEVVGKATDGTLDSDLQIVDPDWSAKAIKEWYDTGANLRVQHNAQRDPAGKGIHVEGHSVRARVVEPVAVKLVKAGVLQDFSVGIMNPDIRVRDPQFKHLDPQGKAVNGVITGRADGMSKIGEISLVDRGSNFGTKFAMLKAAASGEPEWVGELTAPDEVLAKVAAPKAVKTHTVELPSDVRVTFSPKDLAKLTTFRQRLVDGQDKAATPDVAKNGSMPEDAAMLASEPRSDQEDDSAEDADVPKALKAAEAAVYKRDIDTATRRRLASEGKALPNLSYPIENTEDLGNAARLARSGHGDVKAAKRLIAQRAKELGVPNPLKGGKKKGAAKVATAPDVAKKKKVMCGACGAKQNSKHQHCSECGQGMAGAMPVEKNHVFTCLHCGKELDKGEKFCPQCGKENPGYLPEADHQIPANQDKAAKAKAKAKKAKGKKNPFGGKQSPPFGKDKDGDDDGDDDARKAARVTKGRKGGKGKGRTPGHNAVGEDGMKPAGRHREPDGAPMEALEADAGMSDGDSEKPTHTEQLVGTAKAADPEMAAALTLKALGVPADLGALHALTCPAYDPADVAKAFPHDSFAGLDLSQWQLADLDKAASGPIAEALASLALGQHAAALKGTDPYLLQDLRAEAHKMFTDANPGPSSFPTPGTLSAGRFNRPLITAGHQAASPDHDGPHHVALPEAGGISAGQFTRGYLAEGHAADAPENTHSGGPVSPAEPTGVPSSAPARGYYTNSARDSARHAMEAMHDHISRMFPDVCPMTGSEDIARHPVPTPQGAPDVAPAPGGKKKKNKAAKATARKAAKVKARKAAAKAKAKRRRLAQLVLKGSMSVDQARAKLGMEPDPIGMPLNKADGPSGGASTFAPKAPPAVDPKTIAKAVKAAVRPLHKEIAGQDRALRKLRKETERIAAQPDTTNAPFRGSALTKSASAPPAGAPTATGLADQAQVTKLALLRQEWLNSSDPGAREAAYTELSKLLGVSTT